MLCQIVWCRKFNKAENRQTLTPVSMISYTWASSPVVFTENFSACSPATMATRQPFEDISCIPAPYKAVASKLMQPSKELLVSKEGLVWRNIFWSLWMIINHPTVTTVSLWIPFVQSYWPWVCVFHHTRPRFKQQEMLDQNRRQILARILFQETYVSRIPDSIAAIRFLNSLAAFPHDLC